MDALETASHLPPLDAAELRVLGTLVEKAQTVASQYPMTVNGVVAGANQRNNRDPVEERDEAEILDALDRLRAKGLVHEVNLTGSRVPKYRHVARERLEVSTSELVLMTELMLRGPQTVGELRGRASRMHPLESTDVVGNLLESLQQRQPPLVERLPPAPGTRAERFRHLLGSPESRRRAETLDAAAATAAPGTVPKPSGKDSGVSELVHRVERLERRLAALEAALGSHAADGTTSNRSD